MAPDDEAVASRLPVAMQWSPNGRRLLLLMMSGLFGGALWACPVRYAFLSYSFLPPRSIAVILCHLSFPCTSFCHVEQATADRRLTILSLIHMHLCLAFTSVNCAVQGRKRCRRCNGWSGIGWKAALQHTRSVRRTTLHRSVNFSCHVSAQFLE